MAAPAKTASSKPASSKTTTSKPASSKPTPAKKSAEMPEDVDAQVGWFDRFATGASKIVSRAWFFAFCVVLVVIWAPSILVVHSISTWQLLINTTTTIITFLLVALLQNTQERSDKATQAKLNAMAAALAKVAAKQGFSQEAAELRSAVGLEDRESSDNK